MVAIAEPYIGKYFSQDYVRRKVLRQTDEEILEQNKLIDKEIKTGVIPDPATMMVDPATGQPIPATPGVGGDLGKPVMEPNLDAQGAATEASGKQIEMPKPPKGGEI
jgi:hypothetical protein